MPRKSTDTPFVQIPHALRHSGVSDGALATYVAIMETAWRVGGVHFRGIEALAASRRSALSTVRRHLRELESVGAVHVTYLGARRKAHIEVLDWAQITTKDGHHPGVSAHRWLDERSPVGGVPAHDRASRIEEDTTKKTQEKEAGRPGERELGPRGVQWVSIEDGELVFSGRSPEHQELAKIVSELASLGWDDERVLDRLLSLWKYPDRLPTPGDVSLFCARLRSQMLDEAG
jgi:hypothetical protein